MRVLALDLSTTRTGWAMGIDSESRPKSWGSVEPNRKTDPLDARIDQIVKQVLKVAKDFRVAKCVIEETNYSRNMKVLRALLGLRGVVMVEFYRIGIKVDFVYRATALKLIGVKQSQGKEGVIKRLNNLGMTAENDDEADAIAIWLARNSVKTV